MFKYTTMMWLQVMQGIPKAPYIATSNSKSFTAPKIISYIPTTGLQSGRRLLNIIFHYCIVMMSHVNFTKTNDDGRATLNEGIHPSNATLQNKLAQPPNVHSISTPHTLRIKPRRPSRPSRKPTSHNVSTSMFPRNHSAPQYLPPAPRNFRLSTMIPNLQPTISLTYSSQ